MNSQVNYALIESGADYGNFSPHNSHKRKAGFSGSTVEKEEKKM